MPRYRYKRAFFVSPKLGERIVMVQRLSDAIAILKLLGDGMITLEAKLDYGEILGPRAEIPIRHLSGKNEESIWWLFDGEIDVSRARSTPRVGREVHIADRGRWPGCPQDIHNVLDGALPDSIYWLRHFAALLTLKINIREHHFAKAEREVAAIDAGLDETETIIAFRALRSGGCRDLLYLR